MRASALGGVGRAQGNPPRSLRHVPPSQVASFSRRLRGPCQVALPGCVRLPLPGCFVYSDQVRLRRPRPGGVYPCLVAVPGCLPHPLLGCVAHASQMRLRRPRPGGVAFARLQCQVSKSPRAKLRRPRRSCWPLERMCCEVAIIAPRSVALLLSSIDTRSCGT